MEGTCCGWCAYMCTASPYVCDLEVTQMNMQSSLIQELLLYKIKLSRDTMEATKNICFTKHQDAVDHSTVTKDWRNFNRVARTLMIRQSQVGPKLWIPRPFPKWLRQIQEIALKEYQVSSASHCTVWFVTFMTLAKYLEFSLNCDWCYQNIAKFLTHPSKRKEVENKKEICNCVYTHTHTYIYIYISGFKMIL